MSYTCRCIQELIKVRICTTKLICIKLDGSRCEAVTAPDSTCLVFFFFCLNAIYELFEKKFGATTKVCRASLMQRRRK
jgi:hypothetical protein